MSTDDVDEFLQLCAAKGFRWCARTDDERGYFLHIFSDEDGEDTVLQIYASFFDTLISSAITKLKG